MKIFTVIGFWYDDEPVVVGVIEGEHNVEGGNTGDLYDSSFQGEWFVSVSAASAAEAEDRGIDEIIRQEDDEEESEEG